ncbi:peroxiredoxin family protein [Candidatus Omnitrophota bacterium]
MRDSNKKRSSNGVKRIMSFVITLAILPIFLVACNSRASESGETGVFKGDKAADFTLNDLKGNEVSLSDFLGKKAIFVDFSATWCPHCVTAIPLLKDINNKYTDDSLVILGVFINESKKTIEKFAAKHDIPYPVLIDTGGKVATEYSVSGVPMFLVIDKSGLISYRGHSIPEDIIDKVVKE